MKKLLLLLSLYSPLAIAGDTTIYLGQKKTANGADVLIKADKSIGKRNENWLDFVTITDKCQCKPLEFDASMPKHRHGMFVKATKPELLKSDKDSKTYKIDGVKLRMPGYWELELKPSLKIKKKFLKPIPAKLINQTR